MQAGRQAFRAALALALTLALRALAVGQAAAQPAPIIDSHHVETSAATGSFSAPDFGVARHDVTVGTYLSHELAHTIATTHPSFTSSPYNAELEAYGTLSNYEFLTSDLERFGNAGDQLFDFYDQLVADLRADHPGYNFEVTKTAHADASLGAQSYSLFGGVLDSQGNLITEDPNAGYSGNDQVTVVIGDANVYFYQVDYSLSVVSTNSITIVKQTDMGDGTFSFTSSEPALNTTLTTSGGTASSGPIFLNTGTYTLTEAAGGGDLTSLSCDDPDGGTIVDLASRTATIDLDEGENITCTFTDRQTEARTSALIHNFLHHRLDTLFEEGPDRSRLIRRFPGARWATGVGADTPLALAGSLNGGGGMPLSGNMSFATSLSRIAAYLDQADRRKTGAAMAALALADPTAQPGALQAAPVSRFDIWTEAHYRAHHADGGDVASDFALFYLGADYLVTPDLLLGVLGQFDWSKQKSSSLSGKVEGHGWMAGPYLSARLQQSLFLDLRVAWGTSANTVDPFGLYSDGFDTTRWLTTARLTGNWVRGRWRITPSVTVKYGEEHQKGYRDSTGTPIPGQTVSLGRLEFGPEVAYRCAMANGTIIEPALGLTGLWDFAGDGDVAVAGTPVAASHDRLRGKVETGAEISFPAGASLRLSGSYDGIGTSAHAYAAAFRFSEPLR